MATFSPRVSSPGEGRPAVPAVDMQAERSRILPTCSIYASGVWDSTHAVSVWQRLTVAFLAVVALVCVHHILASLHAILIPFFLSGFIVFALQPSVEVLHLSLSGLSPPYRWMICCCRRPRSRATKAEEQKRLYGTCAIGGLAPAAEFNEDEPLLEQVPTFAAMAGETLMRMISVMLAIGVLVFVFSMFLLLLGHGAMHMKDHWGAYRDGLHRLQRYQERAIDEMAKDMGVEAAVDERVKLAYDKMLDEAQELVWDLMNHLLTGLTEGVTQLFIVLLYVLFWLAQPLPTGGKVSSVVRSYLWKKSFVSALYGICVSVLFISLGIDLAIFFGVVSFFLNFVPEVGAFVSMIVPIPVILLDGRLHNPLLVLFLATMGQLTLKFIIGNILEVKLIERDKEMSIHPVWIILGLSYFGYIWGSLGALLSVPMLAMIKTALLHIRGDVLDQTSVVPALSETFLACLEGRNTCWARPKEEDQSPASSGDSPGPIWGRATSWLGFGSMSPKAPQSPPKSRSTDPAAPAQSSMA
mmetsp:Transcript_55670/g.161323  ORF Transcript_55670/g.161323 Transcript_55670/m.161323 type:complete len:525 (-) Transcript_55670:25-1599(-)